MRERLAREDGQVLPLLAAGLLVVLLGVAALVVDLGRVYLVKRQLQSIADAAALAASDVLPEADAARAAGAAYGPDGKNRLASVEVEQTVTPWCLRSLPYCFDNEPGTMPADGRANGVVVTERASVPTTFARLFGVDTVEVSAKATACGMCSSQPLDVALVLDRTGSMEDDIEELRQAARDFLESLDPRLVWVSLLVLPPPSNGDACDRWAVGNGAYPREGSSYPASSDDRYVVVHLANDYKNADGTLNEASPLVRQISCLAPRGGTSYKQALVAAQEELVERGSGRENVRRVIVFETDGAANMTPDSAYDRWSGREMTVKTQNGAFREATVYLPRTGRSDDVDRPCGSAVDYAEGTIEPSGTTIYTVAYAVEDDDGCFASPNRATVRTHRDPWRRFDYAVGYQNPEARESITATEALERIASEDAAYTPDSGREMSESFAAIATDLVGARLVPDDEAG